MGWLSATDQMGLVARGDVTPIELRDAGIGRCEDVNPRLGFMVSELYERAPGGVPMLLKDAGQEIADTSHWAGLAALRDVGSVSTRTTSLASRLEQSGFSIIGKSACPPLANGVTTEPAGFMPTRNPWNLDHSVGGSSGGAAASVASGAVAVAHGSDATGSLRFPAALCGLVTLVPSARTLDGVPPCGQPPNDAWRDFVLARDARDLVLVFDLLHDGSDAVGPAGRGRVGVLDHDPELGLAVDVVCQRAVGVVAALLDRLGFEVEVDWPRALGTLWQQAGQALAVVSDATRPWVLRWVEERLGRPLVDGDVPRDVVDAAARDAARTDEDRGRAQTAIQSVVHPLTRWWDHYDILATPATFKASWPLGGEPGLAECGTLAAPFSLTGQPSIVVPVPGAAHAGPVGVQLVGRKGSDRRLLELACTLQSHLGWLSFTPSTFAV